MSKPLLTNAIFEEYKALYPDDAKLQALTMDEMLTATAGVKVDFNTITYPGKATELLGDGWTCAEAVGYVVFDCVCLFLGAASLRSSLTTEAAEGMAKAVQPVMSQMEKYIATMAASTSSKTDVATAVFGIISTIYSGGCLGAVLSAFLGSLTWYEAALYGVTAMATIVAALATDGAAEIALIVIELATAGFLVNDSINCVSACNY